MEPLVLVGEYVGPTRVIEFTYPDSQQMDRCNGWIFGFKLAPLVMDYGYQTASLTNTKFS